MSDDCIVDIVNRNKAIAVTTDGARLPIVTWLDDDGETCHPEAAVVCVAEYGEKFITIDLREFYRFAGN